MKKILFVLIVLASLTCLFSCKKSVSTHPFQGSFVTETGIKFSLRTDSTTLIQYDDSSSYEGTWSVHKQGDTLVYATIEFAGYYNYYYLRNGKLYRNERSMMRQTLGEELEYQD
jgi:hypothetical protein